MRACWDVARRRAGERIRSLDWRVDGWALYCSRRGTASFVARLAPIAPAATRGLAVADGIRRPWLASWFGIGALLALPTGKREERLEG